MSTSRGRISAHSNQCEPACRSRFCRRSMSGTNRLPQRSGARRSRSSTNIAAPPSSRYRISGSVTARARCPPAVRTGALDLVFRGATDEREQPRESLVHVSFRPGTSSDTGDELPDLVRLDQCELRLHVVSIAPGSQDDLPGEEFAREQETFQ